MQSTDTAANEAFDFDSKEHIAYVKTPAAKAINTPAGLWVATDNQQLAGWQEGREVEGGKPFGVSTRKYDDQGEEIKIPGVLFSQPRLLVIGRSPLLRGNSKRTIEGLFRKGDRNLGFNAGRRYMLIFLDAKNQPLHIAPIQLTAWNSFQVNFDQQLIKFRKALEEAYARSRKVPTEAKSDLWHSMGVFCPQFKSEMRGQSKEAQSLACITTGFAVPTPENWLELCVGRDAIAQEIAILHNSTKDWWKKGLIKDELAKSSDIGFAEDEWGDSSLMPRPASPKCDRNSLMLESERLVQCLGWTQRDGADFLWQNYGKRSRSQLSDAQFLDFVGKLQQAAPAQPVERDAGELWMNNADDDYEDIPY